MTLGVRFGTCQINRRVPAHGHCAPPQWLRSQLCSVDDRSDEEQTRREAVQDDISVGWMAESPRGDEG